MNLFTKIKESFGQGKIKKEQVERLKQILQTAVADGKITDQELSFLNSYYHDSLLTNEEFQRLKSEIFFYVVNWVISDRRVNDVELNSLNQIASQLELPKEIISNAQKQVQYYRLFYQIESGEPLPTGQPANLILQKNEVCYLSIPANLLEERVISRQYVGHSHGVSIRLIKGVSYRVGQQRGRIQSQTGLVVVSQGYFNITNKRLVFSGNKKSVVGNFDKLIDLQLFADGLKYSVTSRQKPTIIQFDINEEAELSGLVISRILNEL